MASLLNTLSLLLASVVVATASSNHECCEPARFVASAGDGQSIACTLSRCNQAAQLQMQQHVVELFDGCRQQHSMAHTIQTAQCFARTMPRQLYYDYVASVNVPEEPSQEAQRRLQQLQMRKEIAALVLGYGCFRNASTSVCRQGLEQAIYVSNGNGILGLNPIQFNTSSVRTTLTLDELIGPCVASPNSFRGSEFDGGMAECSAAGQDGSIINQAVTTADTCYQCKPYSTTEQPFCADFFLTGRSGVRCNNARVVDRVAQTYYSRWNRTGRAHFGDNSFDLPNSPVCHNLVAEMACRATIGECDSQGLRTVCKTRCESRLRDDCQVTSSVAAAICLSMGATSVASSCPAAPTNPPTERTQPSQATTATGGATVAATSAAAPIQQSPYTLEVTADSPSGMETNVSLCFRVAPTEDAQVLILGALGTRRVTSEIGSNTIITGFWNTSSAECAYRAIVLLRALPEPLTRDSTPPTVSSVNRSISTAAVEGEASRALGLPKETVSVASRIVRIPILVDPSASTANNNNNNNDGDGSGQSSLTVTVSLLVAALCAAFYVY